MNVVLQGTGAGRVEADFGDATIQCELPDASHHSDCTGTFAGAGGPGSVRLEAKANPGSVLVRWSSGCSRIQTKAAGAPGEYCLIDYSGVSGPITYTVSAQFDVVPAANRTITLRNASTTLTAYLIGPEDPRPITAATEVNAAVLPGGSRETPFVLVTDPVGSQSVFVAYLVLGGTPAASIGCVVTATAWQNGTHPVVTFNDNEGGGYLVCSEGLVGL